jgi:hypothetical protein
MYVEPLALSVAYVSEVVVAVPSRAAWSVARQSERASACTEAGMEETEKVSSRGGVRVLEWSMKESTPTGCECAAA